MFEIRAGSGRRPAVVAHRGASGHAPENTMAAFTLAHEMGADLLECDVHLSQDGVPVVIHDHTLERTTSGRGLVRDHTAADLARLDAGRGERVPTLDELLDWCRERIPLTVELKNGPVYYEGLAAKTIELVRRHAALERVALISFDHQELRRAKEIEPRITCGALYAALLADGPSVARAAGADALLPHLAFATRSVVEQAHAARLAVSVWTVNEPDELAMALDAGVDAIATDYPDRMLKALV